MRFLLSPFRNRADIIPNPTAVGKTDYVPPKRRYRRARHRGTNAGFLFCATAAPFRAAGRLSPVTDGYRINCRADLERFAVTVEAATGQSQSVAPADVQPYRRSGCKM